MKKLFFTIIILAIIVGGIFFGQKYLWDNGDNGDNNNHQVITRQSKIPATAVKMTPQTDTYPPILHSSEWASPVSVPGFINTAGGEDSAMIMPDGQTLYFWFTPDVNVPAEKQLFDGVTGIYVSKKLNNAWQEPNRILLQDSGKLALDGCDFIQNNTMWFCTTREGYVGIHWFTAEYVNGKWNNWENADFNSEWQVGELHITADGKELYFASSRGNANGNYDIWVAKKSGAKWQEPVKVDAVNSVETDGWPFVTEDGSELWITRTYKGSSSLFRAKKLNGEWQKPELIISQFAGEASLDRQGNIYFTHPFYKNGKMIETDIYAAYKK